jgi:ATP-dependent helicase/nuclease subunit A
LNKPSAQPADAHVRRRVLDPEQSFLVEAPAGSGKTDLLTARFLGLLATVERPEQVLAITFTLAAVAEMRDRVLGALENADKEDTPRNDHELLLQKLAKEVLAHANKKEWQLLEMPARLNIKTVDALALEIASQLPLLSQLGPSLEPIEDAISLYRLAAIRTMRVLEARNPAARLSGSPPSYEELEGEAAWQLLQHRDNNLPRCAQLLAEMLGNRDQWSRHFPLDQDELTEQNLDAELRPELERQLQSSIQQTIDENVAVWQGLEIADRDKLIELANHAGNCEDADDLIRGLRLEKMPGSGQHELRHWIALAELLLTKEQKWRKKFTKDHGFLPTDGPRRREITDLVAKLGNRTDLCQALHKLRHLPPGRYTDEQWTLIKSLFRLLARARRELRQIFVETGRTDFIELNLAALRALQPKAGDTQNIPGNLALAMGEGLEHILVDEFQDTSRTQYDLLRLLVSSWRDDSRSLFGNRTLFLVGDPMQSIYAFRQAEVRLFHQTRKMGIGKVLLQPETLTVNFRCQQSLVEKHNELFPSVFEPQTEVAFNSSVSFVQSLPGEPVNWHFRRKPPKETPDHVADFRREAIEICDQIDRYRDDPGCKIALLLRAKQHGESVLAELRRRDVGYRAVDLEQLSDRQEVLDVASLTRALLHPADRIAWLSVLRAPWCGLSLASLETLCGLELQKKTALPCIPDLLAEHAADLIGDDAAIAMRVRDLLIPASSRRETKRLPRLVFETWQELGGPDCVNDDESANVQAYFRLLDNLDQQGLPINAATLNGAMQQLWAPPNPLADGQIEVMTIHKAKGLTFDVVIVPGMERKPKHDEAVLLDWIEVDADTSAASTDRSGAPVAPQTNLVMSPVSPSDSDRSQLGQWISDRKKVRADAELRRLFYVAATRARRYVHFFAAVVEEHHGDLRRPNPTSLLAVAWDAVAPLARRQLDTDRAVLPALAAQAEPDDPGQSYVLRFSVDRKPTSIAGTPGFLTDIAAAYVPPPIIDDDEASDPSITITAGINRRAIGTVVHSLLEQVAGRISAGESFSTIGTWLKARGPKIQTLLRMRGVPEPSLAKAGRSTIDLVQKMLTSTTGQWILAAHPETEDELRISLPSATGESEHRLDRVFLAGPEPLTNGNSHVWVVDYKTASHGERGLEEFLKEQRQFYGPTMQTYATAVRALRKDNLPVICALYFVAMDRLDIVTRLDP